MAEITDVHFHEVLRDLGGPGLYTAEMVSAQELSKGHARSRRILRRPRGCESFAIQVYGADPALVADAAVQAAEAGADVVDLNLGCPAKKITGKLCGSGLLRDLGLVERMFGTVRAALPADVPLTAKIRLGWDERTISYVTVGRLAEREGLAGITLHGRTRAQMFSGRADWSAVARLADSVSIPVVGNGDLEDAESAVGALRTAGCAGVMIARGALANPWIFRQVRQLLAGEEACRPTLAERRRVILEHHRRLAAALCPREALHRLRKFVGFYLNGVPGGADFRRRLSALSDGASLASALDDFLASLDAETVEAA